MLRFGVPQEVSLPKCSMHYLCPVITTCPPISNLRPCTLSATSCGPFKVRTAVLQKIKVFRDVDATRHPRIFDTDTHHASSFGIWLRTRTCGGGPQWVQLCFIVVDKILAAIFFKFVEQLLASQEAILLVENSVFQPPASCVAAVKRVTTQSSSLLSDLHGCAVMIVQSIIGCVWTACSSCFQTAALRGALAMWVH